MQLFLVLATFAGLAKSQDFLSGLGGLFGGGGGGGGFGQIFQQVAPAFQNPAFQQVFRAAPQFIQPQVFQSFIKAPAPAPAPAPVNRPGPGPAPAPVPDASDYDEPLPSNKPIPKPAPAPAPKPAARAAPVAQGGPNYDDIDYSLTGANPQG